MNTIAIKNVETQEQLDVRIEQQGYVAYWAKIVPPCPYDKGTNGWNQWQKGLDRAAKYEAEQQAALAVAHERMDRLMAERQEVAKSALAKRTEKQKRNKANRDARADASRKLTASRVGKGK